MRKASIFLSLGFCFICFQNFSKIDTSSQSKYRINNEVRLEHAKELLGRQFNKSLAAEETDEKELSEDVYNLVKQNTPKKYSRKVLKITKVILAESKKYGIDPIFVASIIKTESSFDPHARGTSGEIGLMQLMPKTAEYVAAKIKFKNFKAESTLKDPVKNIKIGVAYLNYLRQKFENTAYLYVPAYNMGPGNVMKNINKKQRPKEYSSRVIKNYESLYKEIYASEKYQTVEVAQK